MAVTPINPLFLVPLTPLRLRHPRRLAAQAVDRARVFDTLLNNLEGMAYRCLGSSQKTENKAR